MAPYEPTDKDPKDPLLAGEDVSKKDPRITPGMTIREAAEINSNGDGTWTCRLCGGRWIKHRDTHWTQDECYPCREQMLAEDRADSENQQAHPHQAHQMFSVTAARLGHKYTAVANARGMARAPVPVRPLGLGDADRPALDDITQTTHAPSRIDRRLGASRGGESNRMI